MVDPNLVKSLYENGRAKDLLELLLEESKYTIPTEEYDGDETNLTRQQNILRGCAIDHLRFVDNYGFIDELVEDHQGHVYGPRYKEFEEWLSIGCPGFIEKEFQAYITDNPL